EYPSVEVTALQLDHSHVALEHLDIRAVYVPVTLKVDDQSLARRLIARQQGGSRCGCVRLLGEQVIDGHAIETRQAPESCNGNGAFTALVGAQHRCLELLSGARLDPLEREPPLAPHAPQSPAELACVVALGGVDVSIHRL